MIHGMIWSKYTDVKVKVILKSLFRACYCEKEIKKHHYIVGLLLPTLILGLIPVLFGIFSGSLLSLVFGIVMITGGGDDFYELFLLKKAKNTDWIKNIDSKIGFILYRSKNE